MSDDAPNDVEPIDFDAALNDFAIGTDYAPPIPAAPSNTPRVKRRVIINEGSNTEHDIPAVAQKKKSLPTAVRNLNNNNSNNADPTLEELMKNKRAIVASTDVVRSPEQQTDADAPEATDAEKQVIITQINELKKKLFVDGSGMRPTTFNTMEQLVAERDLCNTQVNSRRGNGMMMALLLRSSDLIERAITVIVPPEQIDVSSHYHLKDEVNECKAMFEEALTQISILHAGWFAVSPYADVAQSMAACVESTNRKNQKVREFEKSPTPSAPNTPASNTATSSQDDDNDVLQ